MRSRELAKRQAALLESIRATEVDIAVMRWRGASEQRQEAASAAR